MSISNRMKYMAGILKEVFNVDDQESIVSNLRPPNEKKPYAEGSL